MEISASIFISLAKDLRPAFIPLIHHHLLGLAAIPFNLMLRNAKPRLLLV
jgi:hypothetical protein